MPTQHIRNEHANSLSHFVGLLLSLIAIPVLVWMSAKNARAGVAMAMAVYGTTLIVVFTSSMLYHGTQHPSHKNVLLIMDRVSIFYLIAGSYTPIIGMFFNDIKGWIILSVIWGLAIVGTVFNIIFGERHNWFSLTLYLGIGWMGVFFGDAFFTVLPQATQNWIWATVVVYMIGVVFYLLRKIPYHHLWWHSCVVLGSACHYMTLWNSVRSL